MMNTTPNFTYQPLKYLPNPSIQNPIQPLYMNQFGQQQPPINQYYQPPPINQYYQPQPINQYNQSQPINQYNQSQPMSQIMQQPSMNQFCQSQPPMNQFGQQQIPNYGQPPINNIPFQYGHQQSEMINQPHFYSFNYNCQPMSNSQNLNQALNNSFCKPISQLGNSQIILNHTSMSTLKKLQDSTLNSNNPKK